MEALRYPDDFDGIIAGAPAVDLVTGLIAQALANHRRQAAHPLTPESVELLDANTRRACDMLDGVADGIVGDPRECTLARLELEKLECQVRAAPDCLTAGQIETARGVYTGVTNASGEVVVPGVYPGSELGGDFQLWVTGAPGFLPTSANELTTELLGHILHRDPSFSVDAFDPAGDLSPLSEAAAAVHLPEPDFSGFIDRGGKLIVYNGWNDHPCRAKALEEFYARAIELNGKDAVHQFMRVFMVPGMVHCAGGPGAWAADYVEALVDWVEGGVEPNRIVATHPGAFTFLEAQAAMAGASVNWSDAILEVGAKTGAKQFTRPLCPYPLAARYTGAGDPDDEASFECAAP